MIICHMAWLPIAAKGTAFCLRGTVLLIACLGLADLRGEGSHFLKLFPLYLQLASRASLRNLVS
jgi:hypothetical protein